MGILGLFGRPMSPGEFAKAIMTEARRLDPSLKVRFDEAHFCILYDDDPERGTLLHMNYHDYLRMPKERPNSIRWMAERLAHDQADETLEAVRSRLRPVVTNLSLAFNSALNWTIVRTIADVVAVGVAVNEESGQRLLNGDKGEWGLRPEELLQIAIDNVRALPRTFKREAPGYYCSDHRDFHDVARILVPEIFAELDLKGPPVAMLASRDRLFVCGEDDRTALDAMASAAGETYARAQHPVSYSPIVLRNGEWAPLEEKTDEPVSVQIVRAMQSLQDYQLQEAVLAARGMPQPGHPLGSINAHDVIDRPRTFTITRDVPCLMPKTDLVAAAHSEQGSVFCRWDDLVSVGMELALRPGFHPARYLADPPTAAQIARLKAEFAASDWERYLYL
jgi:hypothetical protein